MWWFAALHANLALLHARMGSRTAGRMLLDAGCGTGGLLARLSATLPDGAAPNGGMPNGGMPNGGMPNGGMIGLDADRFACERARAKSGRPVCAGSVDALPFADGAFGAIVSADVLCHDGVDEQAALAQFHRCLCDRGILILNLPAYDWLMSAHDRAVANVRRYTRRKVVLLLEGAGFRPLFVSYWNTFLFPLMVLTRKLLPSGAGAASDVKLQAPAVEALCRAATGLEHALLGRLWRLPFGGSVIAAAVKQTKQGSVHA
jgi:SAM-dependent methyltransferase